MDSMRSDDTPDRVREVAGTVGAAAEVIGQAEARLVETTGELAREATRAMGSAAARSMSRNGIGDGDTVEIASDAVARAVEAGAGLAGTVLEAGGTFLRELAEGAGDAAAEVLERRAEREDAVPGDDSVVPPPPVAGPS